MTEKQEQEYLSMVSFVKGSDGKIYANPEFADHINHVWDDETKMWYRTDEEIPFEFDDDLFT